LQQSSHTCQLIAFSDDDYYHIKAVHAQLYLDVKWGSDETSSEIYLWGLNGGDNQKFKIVWHAEHKG